MELNSQTGYKHGTPKGLNSTCYFMLVNPEISIFRLQHKLRGKHVTCRPLPKYRITIYFKQKRRKKMPVVAFMVKNLFLLIIC